MKHSGIDAEIYAITQKPTHYREVRNPPQTDAEKRTRPQDARQVQFNRWCIANQVFCGSYLPYRSEDLVRCGWEKKGDGNKSQSPLFSEWRRKSSGQQVLRHMRHINHHGKLEPTHYHWRNPEGIPAGKTRAPRDIAYLNKYGEVVARGTTDSHLWPWKARKKK